MVTSRDRAFAKRLAPPLLLLGAFAGGIAIVVALAVLGVANWIAETAVGTVVVLSIGWWVFVAGARTDRHGHRPPVTLRQQPTQSELLASVLLVVASFSLTADKAGARLEHEIPYLVLMDVGFFLWSIILANARSKSVNGTPEGRRRNGRRR
jgi:hypothetical protein